MSREKIKIIACVIGLSLIAVNIAGFFLPLRNPSIYKERTEFENDITLTEDELLEAIKRRDETVEVYVERLNEAINKGIAHYWKDEGIDKYNLRVPIYENYLLFIASYIRPLDFEKYEFFSYKKAIERGVGLCSQHAIIISEVLKAHGINSRIILLTGHVVVMAQVDKKKDVWWIVDPDFGVVIKHNIATIEESPEMVRILYSEKGYDTKIVDQLVKAYGKDGNVVSNGVFEYLPSKIGYIEYLSYIFIWIIPLILILPYTLTSFMT